jgi:AcrR family transcriptional regulator
MAARDPEATKERILDAALHEFAAKGIAGARVDAIAKRAGVNKAMLYYYFESKEGLFREVLGQPLTEQWESLRSMDVASADRLVDRTDDGHAPDLGYVRLLAWEALEGDPLQPEDEELRRVFFENWVGAVEERQRADQLPDDLDASQLVLAEVCLTLGPLLLPQLARLITGFPVDDSRFVKARREFLHALTERLDRAPEHAGDGTVAD